jgi:hypothetical protein
MVVWTLWRKRIWQTTGRERVRKASNFCKGLETHGPMMTEISPLMSLISDCLFGTCGSVSALSAVKI